MAIGTSTSQESSSGLSGIIVIVGAVVGVVFFMAVVAGFFITIILVLAVLLTRRRRTTRRFVSIRACKAETCGARMRGRWGDRRCKWGGGGGGGGGGSGKEGRKERGRKGWPMTRSSAIDTLHILSHHYRPNDNMNQVLLSTHTTAVDDQEEPVKTSFKEKENFT